MAKGRMIDASIWTNKKHARLSPQARLLTIGIITTADDQGRIDADPYVLKGKLFTFDEDVSASNIQQWLEMLAHNKTILLYNDDEGEQFAQLLNWWDYQSLQYASPSEYPKPHGWRDRIRYNYSKGSILTCNWILADGTITCDTCDETGKPLPKQTKQSSNSSNNKAIIQVDNQVDNQVDVQEEDKEEDQGGDARVHAHEEMRNPPPPPKKEQIITEEQSSTLPEKINPRVRMSAEQTKLLEGTQAAPETTRIMAAEPLPPRVSPNRVISGANGEQILIRQEEFTEMCLATADACGLRALWDLRVAATRRDVSFAVEGLAKMSATFRTQAGINALLDSWRRARPETVPRPDWLIEHASKFLSGKVRYPQAEIATSMTLPPTDVLNFVYSEIPQ